MSNQSQISRRGLLEAATALGAGSLLGSLTPSFASGQAGPGHATAGTPTRHEREGEIHELKPGVYIISGRHSVSEWYDPHFATIVAVHAGTTLYLLDSGMGKQKQAILDIAGRLRGQFTELVLLNSHGHLDHTGNNDVIGEIEAATKRHYISELSRPFWDPDVFTFFRNMYNEGGRYFDYLQGLDVTVEGLMPLLTRSGLDPHTDPARLTDVARHINELGLTRVISHFWGDLMARIYSENFPALHPSRETMTWYETLPRETFEYGAAQWTGWRVGDICVLEAHGHSADGVLFYVPAHRFLFFADETTSIPVWKDTNTDNSARSFRNALAMVDAGAVESFVASHNPMEVVTGADAIRATITSSLETKLAFDREVSEAVARFPDGVAIDDLFTYLRDHTQGVAKRLADAQFPQATTPLKLTLLNFCRRRFAETQGAAGRPVFK